MIKLIDLTQGKVSCVDDADYSYLVKWRWFAQRTDRGVFYAVRTSYGSGEKRAVFMHREVAARAGFFELPDHRDGDGLNNCRANLRPATPVQNTRNRVKQRGAGCPFKGVSIRGARWVARITILGETLRLGVYDSPVAAAKAYDRAAREKFGAFARLNFPETPSELSATVL